MIKKGLILLGLFVFLMLPIVMAQTVTRQIEPSEVYPDGTFTVTLSVTVGTADAYAIDETIPSSYAILSAPDASTVHQGHVKYLAIGDSDCTGLENCVTTLSDTTYVYTLQAPSTTGTSAISGEYMFDVQTSTSQVSGETSLVVVAEPPTECSAFLTETDCIASALDCGWCPLDSLCKPTSSIECTSTTCFNTTHRCGSTCTISACGVGRECVATNTCQDIGENNTNTTPPGCSPSWSCTDWTPDTCPADTQKYTRVCTDSNSCGTDSGKPDEMETCYLPRSSGTGGSGSGGTTTTGTTGSRSTTTGTRDTTTGSPRGSGTSGGSSSSGSTLGGRETSSSQANLNTDSPLGTEDTLDEQATEIDYLFWILVIVLVVMVLGFLVYYKKRGVSLNNQSVNLRSQKQFISVQAPRRPRY